MAARLWTALLMLAAVFAMHGLQCTSAAAHGTADPTTPAHAAAVAVAAPLDADGHMADAATPGLPDPLAGDQTAGPLAAAPINTGYGDAPHGSVGHLWTLCLAVLAAGIAVLLALLAPRLVEPASPALRRARARTSAWLSPARPPDLFSLCTLRT
jgi:peptidoglycan/LPS O-acetylase OafA/YrhL